MIAGDLIIVAAFVVGAIAALLAVDKWLMPTLLDDKPDPDDDIEAMAHASGVSRWDGGTW